MDSQTAQLPVDVGEGAPASGEELQVQTLGGRPGSGVLPEMLRGLGRRGGGRGARRGEAQTVFITGADEFTGRWLKTVRHTRQYCVVLWTTSKNRPVCEHS